MTPLSPRVTVGLAADPCLAFSHTDEQELIVSTLKGLPENEFDDRAFEWATIRR